MENKKTIVLETADAQGWIIDKQEIYIPQPPEHYRYNYWYFLTLGDKQFRINKEGNLIKDIPSAEEIEVHLRDVIQRSDGDLGVAKYIADYILNLIKTHE